MIVKDILIEPHQYLMISATHLKAKSSFQDEREYQIKQLIEKVKQMSADFQHVIIHTEGDVEIVSTVSLPVIICGDFNDIPESKMYNAIMHNINVNINSTTTTTTTEQNSIHFSSAYKLPPPTTVAAHPSSSILSADNDCKKSRINHIISECDNWNTLSHEPLFTTWKSRHNEISKYTGDYIFYFRGGYGSRCGSDNSGTGIGDSGTGDSGADISRDSTGDSAGNSSTCTNGLTQSIIKNRIGLDSVLVLPTEKEIQLLQGVHTLPNSFYPSDHLSLVAKFYYMSLT